MTERDFRKEFETDSKPCWKTGHPEWGPEISPKWVSDLLEAYEQKCKRVKELEGKLEDEWERGYHDAERDRAEG